MGGCVFAGIIQKLEEERARWLRVAELRVEVGTENCPDGAGEGRKVRRACQAAHQTRRDRRSTSPRLGKDCQVEEGAERDGVLRERPFQAQVN